MQDRSDHKGATMAVSAAWGRDGGMRRGLSGGTGHDEAVVTRGTRGAHTNQAEQRCSVPHPAQTTMAEALTNVGGQHDFAHPRRRAHKHTALLRGRHHRVQRQQLVPAGQGKVEGSGKVNWVGMSSGIQVAGGIRAAERQCLGGKGRAARPFIPAHHPHNATPMRKRSMPTCCCQRRGCPPACLSAEQFRPSRAGKPGWLPCPGGRPPLLPHPLAS